MNSRQQYRRLSLPTGTETLQLREAARHHRITRTLEDLFARWGYDPAETAMVDYFDVYRRLLREDDIRQVYRAVDRQGEILALRSDSTLFLAKQLGLRLTEADLPIRVFYNDQIVRAEDRHNLSNNEYQQAGIELVGVESPDGDAEVLFLALEALAELTIDEAVVHVGSHAVVAACAARIGVDEEELADAVRRRRFSEPDTTERLSPACRALLSFIGPPDQFRAVAAHAAETDAAVTPAVDELITVTSSVTAAVGDRAAERIRIDMSELGSMHYYTGMAFSAYGPTGNAAILRGGRYDHLLRAFGFDAPSVGFSVFTRKLPNDTLATAADDAQVAAEGEDFGSRVAHARKLHITGKRVHLS